MVDVEAALRALGRQLDYPNGGHLADAVAAGIDQAPGQRAPRPRRVRPAVAAAVVVALGAIVMVLPQPREAVARWFGIGAVRLTLTDGPLPAGLESELDLGEPVTADQAADAVPFTIAVPDGLGPPAAAFAGRPPDSVSLVWTPTEELPEVEGTGVGLLLTEFPGSTTDNLVVKELGPGTSVDQVIVDGADGFWITGATHVVTYLDVDGDPQRDPTRLAGNTLLWEVDDVTYRMESALGLERMLALAESMRSVR